MSFEIFVVLLFGLLLSKTVLALVWPATRVSRWLSDAETRATLRRARQAREGSDGFDAHRNGGD